MKRNKKIIAVTGAESTGKSTLSEALASHFGVPFIPEYARKYILELKREYTYKDVEIIARKQIEQYRELLHSKHRVIILDTWLLITKIWMEEVFKKVPRWIESEIEKAGIDLFLVCDTDLPWVPDKVRENGGENRERLQKKYIDELEKHLFRYEIVKGSGEQRIKNALHFISKV